MQAVVGYSFDTPENFVLAVGTTGVVIIAWAIVYFRRHK